MASRINARDVVAGVSQHLSQPLNDSAGNVVAPSQASGSSGNRPRWQDVAKCYQVSSQQQPVTEQRTVTEPRTVAKTGRNSQKQKLAPSQSGLVTNQQQQQIVQHQQALLEQARQALQKKEQPKLQELNALIQTQVSCVQKLDPSFVPAFDAKRPRYGMSGDDLVNALKRASTICEKAIQLGNVMVHRYFGAFYCLI